MILYYHSVPPGQQKQFGHQLDVILCHAKPVPVDGRRMVLTPGTRYVGITFDDGFANFAEVALPELSKRHLPSTMFVIADALGRAFGPGGRPEKVMTAEQLRALPQDLVTIGSHTSTHPFLPAISEAEAGAEISRSRSQIEYVLGREVLLFSFPFGGFNERLVEQCRNAGYQRVYTTLPVPVFEESNEFAVGRVRVDPDDGPLEFRLKLAGAYSWLPWAFALKRKALSLFAAGKTPSDWLAAGHSVIQDPVNRQVP